MKSKERKELIMRIAQELKGVSEKDWGSVKTTIDHYYSSKSREIKLEDMEFIENFIDCHFG